MPLKHEYRLVSADYQGNAYGEFGKYAFELDPIVKELNNFGRAGFTALTEDPISSTVKAWERTIQIWRDGLLYWWGTPVTKQTGMDLTKVGCIGHLAHLDHKVLGPPQNNSLTNPEFDNDLVGWTAVGLVASVETTIRARRAKAARLSHSTTNGDFYLSQSFTQTNTSPAGGLLEFKVRGRVWVDQYNGPAFGERGLYAQVTVVGTGLYDVQYIPLNTSVELKKWTPMEVTINAPTGSTYTVEVRAYGCNGVSIWDTFFAGSETFVGSVDFVDMNIIIQRLFNYAVAKDGNKTGMLYAGGNTNKIDARLYAENSHTNIFSILQGYAEEGIIDYGVTWDAAGTQLSFQIWAPKRGNNFPNVALELGKNIVDFTDNEDSTQSANRPTFYGSSDTTQNEFAMVWDLTTFGGHALESVNTVPQWIDLLGMENYNIAQLNKTKNPIRVPDISIYSDEVDMPSLLEVGDSLPLLMQLGSVQWNTDVRIVSHELDPNTEILKLGLNEVFA